MQHLFRCSRGKGAHLPTMSSSILSQPGRAVQTMHYSIYGKQELNGQSSPPMNESCHLIESIHSRKIRHEQTE
jgi:hypothetical protein